MIDIDELERVEDTFGETFEERAVAGRRILVLQ